MKPQWLDSDSHQIHRHFRDLVRRNKYNRYTPVWVLRNDKRVIDFIFNQPPSVLYHKTTALKLHRELLKNRDDLVMGRQ